MHAFSRVDKGTVLDRAFLASWEEGGGWWFIVVVVYSMIVYSDSKCLERGFAGWVSLVRLFECDVCFQGRTSTCEASLVSVLSLRVVGVSATVLRTDCGCPASIE